MLIYAGIDESGYGPLFGPLVVARTVFAVEGLQPDDPPPSLWTILKAAVCRRAGDARRRLAVNDSKLLYSSQIGPRHLERGVLAFLAGLGHAPGTVEALLAAVGCDEESLVPARDWYADAGEGPLLPLAADRAELPRIAGRLARAGERTGTRLLDAAAAVVFEDRFNRLVAGSGSKAACNWRFVGRHLAAIWERWGAQAPHVVVDRQGGRRDYGEVLSLLFPASVVAPLEQGPLVNRYLVIGRGRSMTVTVQVASETDHLPTALAAMTAKYVRELLMWRFQAYWRRHAPGVRPTCGYFGDGRRFLREIEPDLLRLRIDRDLLVRRR